MLGPVTIIFTFPLSPPSRGAWIEILLRLWTLTSDASPPSRGAWIEIALVYDGDIAAAVAPLAGGVD